eukprot:4434130-Alexandrium_andersonii.AAC.1
MQPGGPKRTLTSTEQQQHLDERNTLGHLTGLPTKLAPAMQIGYVVEQPASSLLFHFEPVQRAL